MSAINLVLLICLSLASFIGQGWLLAGPLLNGSLLHKKRGNHLLQEIPQLILTGMVINYGLVLVLHSLEISLFTSLLLGFLGLLGYGISLFRYYRNRIPSTATMNKGLGAVFVCLLFLGPIIGKPLTDWDARSIWFFHAKMVFTAGAFSQNAGWQDAVVKMFSHPDYPNLIPTLAAQVAQLVGFWNEYLPKLSLFFILVPAITLLFSFARRSLSFFLLVLLLLFSINPYFWNGYMDGYLALYFAIAILFMGKYVQKSQPIDLTTSICCLLILPYLKNEGMLAVMVGGMLIPFIILFYKKSIKLHKPLSKNWNNCLYWLILLLPIAIWFFYKKQWGLVNGLEVGSAESLARLVNRLGDGSIKTIFTNIGNQVDVSLLLLGVLFSATVVWKKFLPVEMIPAVFAAFIYCIGMIVVYLMTPYDLSWHLHFSIQRTLLPVIYCLYVASYYLYSQIEAALITDYIYFGGKLRWKKSKTSY